MERRRQARTPVNINALLIGEKTVPKGCRVMNVSQNGMQLQCDADGRLLTFKEGDSVDVHLSIQHRGKQRKLTIPSWVRHVAANSVDVEFHKQDPQLVDLIESYRASEQHRLEASLGRKDRRVAGSRPASAAAQTGSAEIHPAPAAVKPNNRPFYTIILAAVFTVCVITGGYVYTASIDSRISTLETLSERQSTELSEIQDRVLSASLQEGRYASLNARISALNDAFVSLENRLTGVAPTSPGAPAQQAGIPGRTDSRVLEPATGSADESTLPGRVAGVTAMPVADEPALPAATGAEMPAARSIATPTTASRAAARNDEPATSGSAPDRTETPAAWPTAAPEATDMATPEVDKPAATSPAPDSARGEVAGTDAGSTAAVRPAAAVAIPAATGPDVKPEAQSAQEASDVVAPSATRSGPWVINLISSRDKAYVEQFSKQSGAEQHDAVMNSAVVKGRQYWRLQITGFESAAAARKHAVTVKRALGIKDVWIFKQK